jgi:hypothetical protein
VISNKGMHFFVIYKLLLSEAAGHQQNIELRRLRDAHFGRQNQPLNIADRGLRFRDHMSELDGADSAEPASDLRRVVLIHVEEVRL